MLSMSLSSGTTVSSFERRSAVGDALLPGPFLENLSPSDTARGKFLALNVERTTIFYNLILFYFH